MNQRSFKIILARRLTAVTALLVLLVFGLIYLVVNITVTRRIDQELELELAKHKGQIFLVNGQIRFLHKDEWEEEEHTQIQLKPIFIEIVDMQGKSMDRSPNLRENHLGFYPERANSGTGWTLKLGAEEVRQMQILLTNGGNNEGYLLVAQSFEDARNLLDNLRNILLLLYPLTLMVLFFTMRFLAGRSIQPIREIILQTNQISQSNLNERVSARETNQEIIALTHSINQLLERLEKALKREKQFTSDASHELRTPLSVLRGTLEVLIRKPRTQEEYEQKIRTALGSIDRMSSLIEQLLTLARVENGSSLVFEEIELITFLEEIADEKTKESGRKVRFDTDSGAPIYVMSSEKSLRIILSNLLDNALKYSQDGQEVILSTGKKDNEAFIAVEDFGLGISEEVQEKIFDPFFRETSEDRKGIPGMGLGLALVKKLAEEIHLRISWKSEVGKGSKFTLWVPSKPVS
ncbi:sensor histidine kinase [Algoriphagus mannitolivorans]|uniref:sensor histidine kinase n=1 Tax=Algoriphagus mannitolivorans TaxID=226504 RepID=UPI0004137CE4|nr:HAMP domain-containing sensor histidine kinase [Algoriphagus mannitolivorans]